MATRTQTNATLDDLYHVPDHAKAELVNGEIVLMPPTGALPGFAADEIFVSLRQHAKTLGYGRAVGDNKGFVVNLPHRRSFSPDAAFYVGPDPGMKFFQGAPVFAVEVLSEGDYDASARQAMRVKRLDYFAAGTLVGWEVDLLGPDVVRLYRATDPDTPTIYRRGDMAEAEPAVPGWRLSVSDLFPRHA